MIRIFANWSNAYDAEDVVNSLIDRCEAIWNLDQIKCWAVAFEQALHEKAEDDYRPTQDA
jgi:hypothetical protein